MGMGALSLVLFMMALPLFLGGLALWCAKKDVERRN